MNREIQQRLQWVKLYEMSGDAGFVCRRCVTISAPHCVNGDADIWLRASLVWKAIAVALNIHHQRKTALAKSL